MQINTKAEMYRLYEKGLFGNTFRIWPNLLALKESQFSGAVTIRYRLPDSPFCRYNVKSDNIPNEVGQMIRSGADSALFTFNENAPDNQLLVQGEVMLGETGLVFRHSDLRTKMRTAMEYAQHSYGLAAVCLLRRSLTPSSYEDLQALLDIYPECIVELSAYQTNVGCIPGRNTVVWEVRSY